MFLFTWWLAGRLGLDDRLRALLASAVSICGVSAAIAAAGAVQAKREQLAYTASLVIVFALPSIFLLPVLADVLGLCARSPGPGSAATSTPRRRHRGRRARRRAGAADRHHREGDPERAHRRRRGRADRVLRPQGRALRRRSARPRRVALAPLPEVRAGLPRRVDHGHLYVTAVGDAAAKPVIATVNDLRTLFLILAFVSIGLEFRLAPLREAGWRPVAVFAGATVVNLLVGLRLATLLFSGFPAA